MTAKKTLLHLALMATLFAAVPAFAQDAPPPPETEDAGSSVPQDRLVNEYSDGLFAGDDVAASDAVTALRTGGDFTVVTTTTQQAVNPDGTPATNPDGTPRMETVTVETAVANPNGPMGWGEVDHSLGLAQALVDNGSAANVNDALLGVATTTTVTNPDGTTTTTTTYAGGLLQMRADGMGWGQIAKDLGFKSLGEIKGNGKGHDAADGDAVASADAKSGKGRDTAKTAGGKGHDKAVAGKDHKPDHVAKVDREHGKPDRIAKVDRPSRPDRVERPQKPERPDKPERGRP
ncbi:hypothetical protein [Lysobacter fragariae]